MLLAAKAALVVRSCKTPEQREVARRYLRLAERRIAFAFDQATPFSEDWVLGLLINQRTLVGALWRETQ